MVHGARLLSARADTGPDHHMGSPLHLVGRFFGMLAPVGPRAERRSWAESHLNEAEVTLFRRMKLADQRHAAGVAWRASKGFEAAGIEPTTPMLAAALLHDVGKTEARLGVYGRVVATVCGIVAGDDTQVIKDWTKVGGFTRRVGLYLQHPRLGGDVVALAGSDPLVEAWTREHHLPPERWTIDPAVGAVLKAADGD